MPLLSEYEKPVKQHYEILLMSWAGWVFDFYDLILFSFLLIPIGKELHLSNVGLSYVLGASLAATAIGGVIFGILSDRFGRKKARFIAAVLFLLSAIGTSLPRDIWTFIVFRILGGVGIGVASISTPMYIAEITPAHLRGRLVSVNQIAIVGGIAATSFVNYFIAGHGDQAWNIATGWRWMFAMGIAPAVAFFLLLLRIPESPRWLVEMGRADEARAILGQVGGAEFSASEFASIRDSLSGEKGTWNELFSPNLRLPLVIGIALAILQQVTGINVFMYFGATIFKTMSQSTGVDAGLLQQVVINGAGVFFTLIAIASVDKLGRKPLMLVGTLGMGISLVAMGIMAQTMSDPTAASHLMLAFIVLYIACFGLSVGPVTWVILSEIFPTAVRGRALGLATFCLWIADYAVTQTFPMMDAKGTWLVAKFNHAFPFYVYAAFCAVLIVVLLWLVPETKGRSLEEIERSWKK